MVKVKKVLKRSSANSIKSAPKTNLVIPPIVNRKPVYAKPPAIHITVYQPKGRVCPYLRINANGSYATDRSTHIRVKPGTLNTKTFEIEGDPDGTALLANLIATVRRTFTERVVLGLSLDPNVIRDVAFGLRDHHDVVPTVVEGLRQYQMKKEQQLDIVLTLASVKRYRQHSGILERFFIATSGYGERIAFQELRPSLEYDLLHYLLVTKKYKRSYSLKVFQYLKSILTYAVAHGWTDRNVLGAVRLKKHHQAVETLTMADIAKLKAMTFVEPNAILVRDMFLMAIFSGMAYTDLVGLRAHHIVEVNGVNCFVKDRQKSGVQAFVPVFPDAQALLDKYARNEMCLMKGVLLPMLTNQAMNAWLKIIGNLAGIKQILHMHLGRKSFTTYAEELGFTLNDMATMLGHSHVSMTERSYYQRRREPVVTKFKEIFINPNADRKAV